MPQHNEATAEQARVSARDQRKQQAEAKASPGAARPGYKRTKLGWIPEEWALVRLGDVFEFRNGYNTTKENYGAGVPFVNVLDVITHQTLTPARIKGKVTLSKEAHVLNDVRNGDVLFNRTSETTDELGMASVYLDNEVVTFGGFVIRGRQQGTAFDPAYLSYSLRDPAVRKQISALGNGAIRSNIGQGDLQGVLAPKPPLPEQQRIATLLGTWDAAITKLEQLIAAKQRRKLGLMQELLSGKRRFPGFTEKWKEVRLGKLFTERIETGLVDLPLLSVGAAGVYPQSDDDRRDNSNPDKAKYKRICPGDIGYNTMRMWQGRCALSALEGIVSPAYTILTPTDKIDVVFGSQLFKWSNTIHLFYRNSQGMASDTWNLKYKEFAPIKVTIPGLEEQRLIGEVLNAHDASIEKDAQLVNHLTTQKRGLMQQLLTGAVRTKANSTRT